MGFKKIVITDFDANGALATKSTLGLKTSIEAANVKEAKAAVQKLILPHVVTRKNFTVGWERNGTPEGYMVTNGRVGE